ncbi:hypothetical protein [Pectobacterium aroidearum]|uniref:hypothetical protein n=1 Tax=Pectobacterium aroidearum TaxID=1201031 RepID=UPI003B84A65F
MPLSGAFNHRSSTDTVCWASPAACSSGGGFLRRQKRGRPHDAWLLPSVAMVHHDSLPAAHRLGWRTPADHAFRLLVE